MLHDRLDIPDGGRIQVQRMLPTRFGLQRALGCYGDLLVELWFPSHGLHLPKSLLLLPALRQRHLQRCLLLTQAPDGTQALVLELLADAPLVHSLSEPLPEDATLPVLQILGPLCQAVDALHGAGLCHLQIRPEHIYLVPDDRGVVLGGLGQVRRSDSADSPIAQAKDTPSRGALLASCAYMSPEQIIPERAQEISRRTDVYALGALAFHLLTGVPPCGPDGEMATLGSHLQAWRPLASRYRSDLGEAVDAVLTRAMDVDPDKRHPSCGELLDDLRAALAASPRTEDIEGRTQSPPCVLVVAGNTKARREMQGLVSAVAPRYPVLADAGGSTVRLALRYRPQLILLHQPSLSDLLVVNLCKELRGAPDLTDCHVVAVLAGGSGPQVQELTQLGATVKGASGRSPESWPLVQYLRRILAPPSSPSPASRSTSRRI